MSEINKAPIGTYDFLPDEIYKAQYVEKTVMDLAYRYGFKEIRTPTFEATEVFTGSVGDTSDVVQKEMYTFDDKGGRSMTLRPEQTAGITRAMIQHGLLNQTLPQKVCSIGNAFRYERPQAGRNREFNQINIEMFGPNNPVSDAELICLGQEMLYELGIKNISLRINSIGCEVCKAEYFKILKIYFKDHKDNLDEDSLKRLNTNPMRILDSKVKSTMEIVKDAPKTMDNLCENCKTHFNLVLKNLDNINIKYEVDPLIVRGLDYYTKTVFEFISNDIGSQGAVGGGGRYDLLVEKRGGKPTPALGFGLGLERIIMVMENLNIPFLKPKDTEVFIAAIGEKALETAFILTTELRKKDIYAQCDLMERSVRAQMKFANKISASYTLVLGDNEINSNKASIRNMDTGAETLVSLDADKIIDAIYNMEIENAKKEIK